MDKQHADRKFDRFVNVFFVVTMASASSQTWMSIFKMLLVIAVCYGQFYFITAFFQTKGKQGGAMKDVNPFGRSVI